MQQADLATCASHRNQKVLSHCLDRHDFSADKPSCIDWPARPWLLSLCVNHGLAHQNWAELLGDAVKCVAFGHGGFALGLKLPGSS